jgi:hypothetical protein
LLLALLALGFCALSPHGAHADPLPVTFAGEVDSDGPLVIEPAANDDPQTLPVTNVNATVYFIERMPQTKWVTSITLGDFGQGDCSSSSPTARLYAYSRDNNDFNGASAQLSYGPEVPLPATPGRLKFTFDWTSAGNGALLLRKDKAYAFSIQISGCSSFQQTTWAPLEEKMETPARNCISALPFGPNGGLSAKMQWHDALTTQPDPACVSSGLNYWSYEPDGWLVSISPGWSPYIDMVQNISDADPDGPGMHHCESSWAGQNVSQVNVDMPTGNPVMQLDGVCRWNSFYPPGQETRYSWSTALPWRAETGGGPRLPYLKLDTPDWDSTLQQYSPAVKYDSSEQYLLEDARGVATIASSDNCADGANGLSNRHVLAGSDPALNITEDTRYADVASVACPAQNVLSLDNLGPVGSQYPYLVNGVHPVVAATDEVLGDHLSLRGGTSTFENDSETIFNASGMGNHVYGRVVLGTSGDLWLQYYFWYYYNNGYTVIPGADDHEGDWEGIQLHIPNPLSANPAPDNATYNEHAFRSSCGWNLVEKSAGHPVIYVSKGRHASYFTPYKMPSGFSTADGSIDATPDVTDATLSKAAIVPAVEPITAYTPRWLRWPGRWGDSSGDVSGSGGKSPTGPKTFRMWSDPVSWDNDATAGDHNIDVACPDGPPNTALRGAQKVGTHSTAGEGDGPVLDWKRAKDGKVRVRWSLSDATPDEPVTLTVSVHSTSTVYPARLKQIDLTTGRTHGVVEVKIPDTKGPFELVGQILAKSGRWSEQTTGPVTTG